MSTSTLTALANPGDTTIPLVVGGASTVELVKDVFVKIYITHAKIKELTLTLRHQLSSTNAIIMA